MLGLSPPTTHTIRSNAISPDTFLISPFKGIPHCTTASLTYDTHHIPAKTILFPNLTALSKDPDRYPDPELFNPRRFRNDHTPAAASALSKDHMQRDHFHYGFGRRVCPGVHVAEASLFIVVSRVLWGFDIGPKEGCAPLDMDAKIGEWRSGSGRYI